MSEIEVLENIIIGYVGPFAKSVIKHQIKLLGIQPDDYALVDIRYLGEKVITAAIFDTELQAEARKDMKKVFNA